MATAVGRSWEPVWDDLTIGVPVTSKNLEYQFLRTDPLNPMHKQNCPTPHSPIVFIISWFTGHFFDHIPICNKTLSNNPAGRYTKSEENNDVIKIISEWIV